ncbi:uS10/mL48 family ribosomal protein [Halococcus salifodinae]|uniref:Small ribosomal subunit protein uS10 n=1 Tax=Halococcus salifodinae DSM 8989 TaxID=1227456 RepID=M0MUN3_9EURY|nr:uS10/mL48 family ribosomal protein [Halococcus salifodinae]EMA49452.1 ribosomal protein S10-like protein [Halococcus salifodinae DSM 8989]
MPFVTKLRLTSGDRGALDREIADIKTAAARKGVEFNGPHPDPLAERRVPQSKHLSAHGGRFEDWTYTVYARSIEIVGHDEFARSVADGFPAGIHAEVEIERIRSANSS